MGNLQLIEIATGKTKEIGHKVTHLNTHNTVSRIHDIHLPTYGNPDGRVDVNKVGMTYQGFNPDVVGCMFVDVEAALKAHLNPVEIDNEEGLTG